LLFFDADDAIICRLLILILRQRDAMLIDAAAVTPPFTPPALIAGFMLMS